MDGSSGVEGATAGESPSDEDQESAAEAEEDLAANPETATTGFRDGMNPVKTTNFSVSTANPLSTRAACDVLTDGGTAADALVTAQLVLGLVEPQASGIGG